MPIVQQPEPLDRRLRIVHTPHDGSATDVVEHAAINRALAVHGEALPDPDVPLHGQRPAA